MSLSLTSLSELEAVNQILATVGETPVSTLNTPGVSVASLARTFLHDASRAVQGLGLDCNTESNYLLMPDINGFIYIPSNTLKVDPVDPSKQYVQRDIPARLYDKENHTFIFNEPVEVDIVFFLRFEELPQAVRKYITVKAARQFQARWVSSDIIHKLTEDDERQAWIDLFEGEMMSSDCSLFDSPETKAIFNRYF